MHEIRRIGSFLEKDSAGNFISDTSAAKIGPPWSDAVDYARAIEVQRFGARLHSLYIRGSVPRGTALPNRSDLDLFAVLFDESNSSIPDWTVAQMREFQRRFPFVAGLETSHVTLCQIHGPFHYYRFVTKISAACIHGEDLTAEIQPYGPDAPIAEEWFRIFPHLVDNFVDDFSTASDEDFRSRLCLDMMKGFLRAGMLLVMKRAGAYTRDLYPSYECFSKFYPAKEPMMRRCLELAVNPTFDARELFPMVTDFAAWMRAVCETEFGVLELLPASLVR
jgi:hypothetical protein